jgi:hypothetical protein
MKANTLLIVLICLFFSLSSDATVKDNPLSPQFPGGIEALSQFIADNTVYPITGRLKGVEGQMWVYLKLNEEGEVVVWSVINTLGPEFTKSVLKMVEKMPNWIMTEGQETNQKVILPISFNLDDLSVS